MKKSKSIMLMIAPVLSTVLFNACSDGSDVATNRDVYQSKEDCLKDWGDEELCQEMNDADTDDYRRSGGVIYAGRPFWGPIYYPGDRTVIYKGRTISPSGRSTTMTPFVVTSRTSATSRTSVSSPRGSSTTYGGFGGRTTGSSSSSS